MKRSEGSVLTPEEGQGERVIKRRNGAGKREQSWNQHSSGLRRLSSLDETENGMHYPWRSYVFSIGYLFYHDLILSALERQV